MVDEFVLGALVLTNFGALERLCVNGSPVGQRFAERGRSGEREAPEGSCIVVVATGARWAGDGMNGITRAPIPGADAALPHVLLPEDVMVDGARPDGRRVAIVDCEGYFTGAGLAEVLREAGVR